MVTDERCLCRVTSLGFADHKPVQAPPIGANPQHPGMVLVNNIYVVVTQAVRICYDEVTGGTFTITNLGAYDIDAFTPIINPPQVGILGTGRVVEKPIIHQGEIAKRSMMFLSLTFDHRVIDGAPAAAFLRDIKTYLEDPWWMVAFPTPQP